MTLDEKVFVGNGRADGARWGRPHRGGPLDAIECRRAASAAALTRRRHCRQRTRSATTSETTRCQHSRPPSPSPAEDVPRAGGCARPLGVRNQLFGVPSHNHPWRRSEEAAGVAPSQLPSIPSSGIMPRASPRPARSASGTVPAFADPSRSARCSSRPHFSWGSRPPGRVRRRPVRATDRRSPLQWAAFAVLMAIGQVLNLPSPGDRRRRRHGFKLGAPVPWSTAFPFSAGFRHLRHVGGFASQLGVFALFASEATIAAGPCCSPAGGALCD